MASQATEPELDRYLRSWRPSGEGARQLGRLYGRAINVDVARRCREVLVEAGEPATVNAERVVRWAAGSGWTTPVLAFARFVELADPKPAVDAKLRALAALERLDGGEPPPTELTPGGPVPRYVRYALARFTEDQRRDDGRAVHLQPSSPDGDTLAACRHALGVLRRAWPDMAATVDALVRELRWYERPPGSSPSAVIAQAFGAVFIARADGILLYDTLVHETTHLELTARMAVDKLLTNGSERAAHPFRPWARRPLSRILHATVVAARVVEALERCQGLIDSREREVAEERTARFAESLRSGLETLSEHGVWTSIGRDLMDGLEARAAELSGSRAMPAANGPTSCGYI